jgi:predicted transcriptional regulator
MSTPLTIQIPPELEIQITRRAAQLNISPETFVLQSLQQAIQEESEYEDEPKEAILASLRTALQEVKDGKVHPIEELWDGIDD